MHRQKKKKEEGEKKRSYRETLSRQMEKRRAGVRKLESKRVDTY